jgi:hypothetical protein
VRKPRMFICVVCGQDFECSWANAKTCGKSCKRILQNRRYRERYAAGPQYLVSKCMLHRRIRIKRRWEMIFSKLGRACSRCGIEYPPVVYDLHHPNGKQSQAETPSRLIMQGSEDVFLSHLENWQLLCANCHRLHHAETDWAPRWRKHELQASV